MRPPHCLVKNRKKLEKVQKNDDNGAVQAIY